MNIGACGEAVTPSPGSLVSCRDVELHGDKLLFRSIRPIIDHSLMINVPSLSVSLLQRVTLMSFGAPIISAYMYSHSLILCILHSHKLYALRHTEEATIPNVSFT